MTNIINDSLLANFEVTFLSKSRIRSRYQRQILGWLTDNSGSVSEISKSVGIRTPHTSLALSELRRKSWVYRDDNYGIRGAVHSITEVGRKRLEQDRLELYRKYANKSLVQHDGILLESSGRELLLCYRKSPPNSLIPLPIYPLDSDAIDVKDSTGTEGVIWASVIPDSIKWYSAENMTPINPPGELSLGTLDAYSQSTQSFALVRANLLEPIKQWNVPPGTGFRTPDYSQRELPALISAGEHYLGTIPGTEIEVTWNNRLHAHLTSEIDINLLVNAFSRNVVILRNNPVKPELPTLPIGSILHWLRQRHKRLDEESIIAKFRQIKSSIKAGSINNLNSTTQRALARDFGYCEWIDEFPNNVEISNITTEGLISIIDHLRTEYTTDYIVEWDWDIDRDIEYLTHLLRDPRCRLLITKTGPLTRIPSSLAMLVSMPKLAIAELRLPNKHVVNIELSNSHGQQVNVAHSVIPNSAIEILQSYEAGAWNLGTMTGSSDDFGKRSEIWQALNKYPEGDEGWANNIELDNPLAAWIATPDYFRASRWVRVVSRIQGEWADLLDCAKTPARLLISSLNQASSSWRRSAIEELSQRFVIDNQILIDISKDDRDNLQASAISSAILLVCDKLPDEFFHHVSDAVDDWLDSPIFADRVLNALFQQSGSGTNDRFNVLQKVMLASEIHPKDSILYNWGRYINYLQNSDIISNELAREFMSSLPYHWWYGNAAEWLVGQMSSSAGRRWIADQSVPWPALLFRLDGEVWGPPGFPSKFVRRIPTTADLLFIPIMQDCHAKDFLMDTFDLASYLEDRKYRITPRTHPKLAYLAMEFSTWPDFSHRVITEGNPEIGSLIFGISYHKNIR